MNYTKGEWLIHWSNIRDKEGSDLRIKLNEHLGGMEDIAIILSPRCCNVKECEANAHLIAAAPDMYEALKAWDELRAMQPLDSGADIDAILQKCSQKTDKALLKAEGKEGKC